MSVEREKLREREPEARQIDYYETSFKRYAERREMARTGKVVIKGKELGWRKSRQGVLKYYIHPQAPNMVTVDWLVFHHDIQNHSGRHRHQGGLVIFVLEGEGYTTVDGVKVEWEAGDLILLPIKPNGVEHQHFNKSPGKPCKWMAFIYMPFKFTLGSQFEQVETAPGWKEEEQKPEKEHYF